MESNIEDEGGSTLVRACNPVVKGSRAEIVPPDRRVQRVQVLWQQS